MNNIKNAILRFSREEDGAQIVEYALIIAVVSIAAVMALGGTGTTSLNTLLDALVTRISTCLSSATFACV